MVQRRRASVYLDAYRLIAYPFEWHYELAADAHERGLQYIVSIYLERDVEPVARIADALKCASFESRDTRFLGLLAATRKPVYVSTGMQTLAEAMTAAAYATTLFHCTSAYVAPLDSLNLRAIRTLQAKVGVPVGYSDHSANVLTGALAVAAGAEALEVHVRLDDCDPANADYAVSLSPARLADYIHFVRVAERAMGDGIKQPQPAEAAMRRYQVRT